MASPTQSDAQATTEPSSTRPPDASTSTYASIQTATSRRTPLTFGRTSEQENGADVDVAANKVFDTVELLEMILLDVPMIDLLVLQRTNKTFRDTMRGSKKLKQHMFLESKPTETTEWNPVIHRLLFKPVRGLDYGVLMRGHLCLKTKTTVHFLDYSRRGPGDYFIPQSSAAETANCCYERMDQALLDRSPPEHQIRRAMSGQAMPTRLGAT